MTEAKAAIDALTAAFFSAFRDPATVPGIADLFLAEGTIVKNLDGEPVVYTVPEFIAPRAQLLAGGRLSGFTEWETSERTEIWGNIAQRWSSYRKSGVLDGVPFTGGGWKSSHFVRTAEGWRLASLIWDDEPQVTG